MFFTPAAAPTTSTSTSTSTGTGTGTDADAHKDASASFPSTSTTSSTTHDIEKDILHTSYSKFHDPLHRHVLLRGVNLSGASKNPRGQPSHLYPGFWEGVEGARSSGDGESSGEGVSFVGYPLNLDEDEYGWSEADQHLTRLRGWGFNMLRYPITWEALEHDGPGKYDEEFIDYTIRVLTKCHQYGFKVFIDPHQDTWSRFSGGDGAPYWTLHACGINPRGITPTLSAYVHSEHPSSSLPPSSGPSKPPVPPPRPNPNPQPGDDDDDDPTPTPSPPPEPERDPASLPAMIWSTNYTRLLSQTLFTFFFAGATYAPKCTLNSGESIQDFLQDHFIGSFAYLAKRIKEHPLGEALFDTTIVGWDGWNEPSEGFIGYPDLRKGPDHLMNTLTKGPMPTPAQSLRLGMGFKQGGVAHFEFGSFGPSKTKEVVIDPKGVRVWASSEEVGEDEDGWNERWGWKRDDEWRGFMGGCVWAAHGVWDPALYHEGQVGEGEEKDTDILNPHYFDSWPLADGGGIPPDEGYAIGGGVISAQPVATPPPLSSLPSPFGSPSLPSPQSQSQAQQQQNQRSLARHSSSAYSSTSHHSTHDHTHTHFPSSSNTSDPISFITDFWRPHFMAYLAAVREHHPKAIMFVQPPPFVMPPPLEEGIVRSEAEDSMREEERERRRREEEGTVKPMHMHIRMPNGVGQSFWDPAVARAVTSPVVPLVDTPPAAPAPAPAPTSTSRTQVVDTQTRGRGRGRPVHANSHRPSHSHTQPQPQPQPRPHAHSHSLPLTRRSRSRSRSLSTYRRPLIPTHDPLHGIASRAVYAPHYYDGLTLITKHWNWFNADALGLLRGKYRHKWAAVRVGEGAIRKCLREQIGVLSEDREMFSRPLPESLARRGRIESGEEKEGDDEDDEEDEDVDPGLVCEHTGGYPTLLGEIGIPFDMDQKRSYKKANWGDWDRQTRALDASLGATEGPNGVNWTVWTYVAGGGRVPKSKPTMAKAKAILPSTSGSAETAVPSLVAESTETAVAIAVPSLAGHLDFPSTSTSDSTSSAINVDSDGAEEWKDEKDGDVGGSWGSEGNTWKWGDGWNGEDLSLWGWDDWVRDRRNAKEKWVKMEKEEEVKLEKAKATKAKQKEKEREKGKNNVKCPQLGPASDEASDACERGRGRGRDEYPPSPTPPPAVMHSRVALLKNASGMLGPANKLGMDPANDASCLSLDTLAGSPVGGTPSPSAQPSSMDLRTKFQMDAVGPLIPAAAADTSEIAQLPPPPPPPPKKNTYPIYAPPPTTLHEYYSFLVHGARAVKAFCRPFPVRTVGSADDIEFDVNKGVWKCVVDPEPEHLRGFHSKTRGSHSHSHAKEREDRGEEEPATIIFIPLVHFASEWVVKGLPQPVVPSPLSQIDSRESSPPPSPPPESQHPTEVVGDLIGSSTATLLAPIATPNFATKLQLAALKMEHQQRHQHHDLSTPMTPTVATGPLSPLLSPVDDRPRPSRSSTVTGAMINQPTISPFEPVIPPEAYSLIIHVSSGRWEMEGQYLKWYYDDGPVTRPPHSRQSSAGSTASSSSASVSSAGSGSGSEEKDNGCFNSNSEKEAKQQQPKPIERKKFTITIERGTVPGVHAKRDGVVVEDPNVCEKMAKEACVIM